MPTKKKTTAKVKPEIFRFPGQQQLTAFLKENKGLLNLSELERSCNFPSGTLRHICAGSRTMESFQYNRIREHLLPKLCEFVLLLQLHEAKQTNRFSRFDDLDEDEY